MRDQNGRFVPGFSGNPAGKPRTKSVHLKELLESDIDVASNLVKETINNKKLGIKIRLQAAEILFDRVCGKPHQSTDLKVEGQIPAVLTGELSDDDIDSLETTARPPTDGVQEH